MQITEAIFTGGVLKPVENLSLRESKRVRLIVEPIGDPLQDREVALKKLREGMRACGSSLRESSRREMTFMTAFDTNVLIYACDGSDRRRQARALDLIASTSDAVLLWQVACEFIAASKKLASQGFGPEDAWKRLNRIPLAFSARHTLFSGLDECAGTAFEARIFLGRDDSRRVPGMRSHSIVLRGSAWSGFGGNRNC
jgi:predicted DNA-binding antitoxin AbrB/MazE fold protein